MQQKHLTLLTNQHQNTLHLAAKRNAFSNKTPCIQQQNARCFVAKRRAICCKQLLKNTKNGLNNSIYDLFSRFKRKSACCFLQSVLPCFVRLLHVKRAKFSPFPPQPPVNQTVTNFKNTRANKPNAQIFYGEGTHNVKIQYKYFTISSTYKPCNIEPNKGTSHNYCTIKHAQSSVPTDLD